MKRSRRTGAGRKRLSAAEEPQQPEEELETLEPVDDAEDLETLDEWDAVPEADPRIRAELTAGSDTVQVTLTAGEDIPKDEFAAAVGASLGALAAEHAKALRWQDVTVEFAGDALIPSAAKAACAAALEGFKPALVVVQRGMGDERVHEAVRPTLDVTFDTTNDGLEIVVDAGGIESIDVEDLFAAAIRARATELTEHDVILKLHGAVADKSLAVLCETIAGTKASKLTLVADGSDPRLVFDRELDRMIQIRGASVDGFDTEVEIIGTDAARVQAGCELVLAAKREDVANKRVLVKAGDDGVAAAVVRSLKASGASAIAAGIGDKSPELHWPGVLSEHVAKDGELHVELRLDDRDRPAVVRAIARELAELGGALHGRTVVVDWADDGQLDDELERALVHDGLLQHGVTRVAYVFGGTDREPVAPAPMRFEAKGDDRVDWHFDTEAGKPAEILRYMDRRLSGEARKLADRDVRVVAEGQGAISRTLKQHLVDFAQAASAKVLRLDDHGEVELLYPTPVVIDAASGSDALLRVQVPGLGEDELCAFVREAVEGADALGASTTVHVDICEHESAVVATLVDVGVGRVARAVDPVVILHPRLVHGDESDGEQRVISMQPAEDGEHTLRQVENELPQALAARGCDAAEVLLRWPDVRPPYPGAVSRAVEILVHAGASTVKIDNGRRMRTAHPEQAPEFVSVLGRRDSGEPPMILLGVDATDGEACIPGVETALGALGDLDGRRVLVVFSREDHEVPAAADDPVRQRVEELLEPRAAAVLIQRERGFEVTHSKLEGLAVGAAFADPRG